MGGVSANVKVAVTGAAYCSESGATVTAPTTAVSTLDTDLKDLGFLSEDGIEENYDDDVTEIPAWQGGQIVRRVRSKSSATFKMKIIENTRLALELYHSGSLVESDGGSGWKLPIMSPVQDRRKFVFDVIDGTEVLRIWIPDGEVFERGAVVYKGDEAIGYEVTITAYPDADGLVAIKFSNSAAWATA